MGAVGRKGVPRTPGPREVPCRKSPSPQPFARTREHDKPEEKLLSDGTPLSLSHSSAPHSFNKVLGPMECKSTSLPQVVFGISSFGKGKLVYLQLELLPWQWKLGNPFALHCIYVCVPMHNSLSKDDGDLCGFVRDSHATCNGEGEDVYVALDFPTGDVRLPSKMYHILVFLPVVLACKPQT